MKRTMFLLALLLSMGFGMNSFALESEDDSYDEYYDTTDDTSEDDGNYDEYYDTADDTSEDDGSYDEYYDTADDAALDDDDDDSYDEYYDTADDATLDDDDDDSYDEYYDTADDAALEDDEDDDWSDDNAAILEAYFEDDDRYDEDIFADDWYIDESNELDSDDLDIDGNDGDYAEFDEWSDDPEMSVYWDREEYASYVLSLPTRNVARVGGQVNHWIVQSGTKGKPKKPIHGGNATERFEKAFMDLTTAIASAMSGSTDLAYLHALLAESEISLGKVSSYSRKDVSDAKRMLRIYRTMIDSAEVRRFDLSARSSWTGPKLSALPGDVITVRSKGKWSAGTGLGTTNAAGYPYRFPANIAYSRNESFGSLLFRTSGDRKSSFGFRDAGRGDVMSKGSLQFMINDRYFDDNQGALTLEIVKFDGRAVYAVQKLAESLQ